MLSIGIVTTTGLSTINGLYNARKGSTIMRSTVPIKGLDQDLRGLTIAQISDLHDGPTIKEGYVEEVDEKEKNLRKSLNLGHTFAHAYEATLGYSKKLNHGEAVIFGLMNAVNFSKEKKIISNSNSELINNHIKKIEIKNKYKDLFNKSKITSILNFMKSDKKNKSDSINLILIRNFGKINF